MPVGPGFFYLAPDRLGPNVVTYNILLTLERLMGTGRIGRSLALLFAMVLLLPACTPETPEERLARLHLPPAGFKGEAVKGEKLFNNTCASCHGVALGGAETGPPLLDDIYRPGHHADLAFYSAVKNGVKQHHWRFGDMPPVAGVGPKDTAHIIAYIRRQQRVIGIR
jgi:mono/diheme cytochrome c family protein